MDAVTKRSLAGIARRMPTLSEEELAFLQDCLNECFEIGRTWDSVPILVQEARPPAPVSLGKYRRQAT